MTRNATRPDAATIIDCHSFPDMPLRRDLCRKPGRPDYCFGTDDFHTPDNLIRAAHAFFKGRNLTVGINAPYSGSIVPAKYYRQDRRVQTIMLEINRRLYLNPNTGTKSIGYPTVKDTVREFIDGLSRAMGIRI